MKSPSSTSGTGASRLVLGTAQIGCDYGIANQHGKPSDADVERLLSHALDRELCRWDTARGYGDAERRIGRFLSQRAGHSEVQIISKLGVPPKDLPPAKVLDWVTDEIDKSRQELHVDCLEAWLIHDTDVVRKYGDALWDALMAQVDRDATKRIGLSVYAPEELRLAADRQRSVAVQLPVNLLDQRFPGSAELRILGDADATVYARSVLLQGVLRMRPSELPVSLSGLVAPLTCLHNLLTEYEVTPLDVALPFVLSVEQVDFVVIGVDCIAQLDDNLRRAESSFPVELAGRLAAAFASLPAELVEPRRW